MAATSFYVFATACWLLSLCPAPLVEAYGLVQVANLPSPPIHELRPRSSSILESIVTTSTPITPSTTISIVTSSIPTGCGECPSDYDCCVDICLPKGYSCCGILAGAVHYCLPSEGICSPCPSGFICHDLDGQVIDKTCCKDGNCAGTTPIISTPPPTPPSSPPAPPSSTSTGCGGCSSDEVCCVDICAPKGSDCCGILAGKAHYCFPGHCAPCPSGSICYDNYGQVVDKTCSTTSAPPTLPPTSPSPIPTGCSNCGDFAECCVDKCVPKGSDCCGIIAGQMFFCFVGHGTCTPCPSGVICSDGFGHAINETCCLDGDCSNTTPIISTSPSPPPSPPPPPPPPTPSTPPPSTPPPSTPPPSTPPPSTPSTPPPPPPPPPPATSTSTSVCPQSTTNTAYTPPTPLPVDYTWGCPPGSLCKPKNRCVLEAAPPTPEYVCSPAECEAAPALAPIQTWGEPIYSNETSFYILQDDYFNLDPVQFGLDFSIFVKVCPVLDKREVRERDGSVPGPCFDDCNAPLLEAQRVGKDPGLCSPGSAFAQGIGNCNACIYHHNGGKGASFRDIQPNFQQFLGYCGSAVGTPVPITSQTGTPTVSGSTAPASPPSSSATAQSVTSPTGGTSYGVSVSTPPPNSGTYISGTTISATTIGTSTISPSTILPSTSFPSSVSIAGSASTSSGSTLELIIGSSTLPLNPSEGLGSIILAGISGLSSSGSSPSKSSNLTTTGKPTTTGSTGLKSSSAVVATASSVASRVANEPWNMALVAFVFASIVLASSPWSLLV